MSAASPSPQTELSRLRRDLSKDSLEAFARFYLAQHFKSPASQMHLDMFARLQEATDQRGARIAIAAPRGHAKTTLVSLAYVLWCVCFRKEPFVVLVSNTGDQAEDLLTNVKNELESNERLASDFPEASEPPGRRPSPKRWRRREIITRHTVKVMALGAGQKIRGRKHQEHRPTLIILDDIENEAEVASAEQRESKRAWFEKALLKAGTMTTTNIVVVGTILHYDALLARLVGDGNGTSDFPGWTTSKYQAVLSFSPRNDLWDKWQAIYACREEHEGQMGPQAAKAFFAVHENDMLEGTNVLWHEHESYRDLMELRVREGQASFDSEKQNEPVDPSTCFFRSNEFTYWDDQFRTDAELLAKLGSSVSVYGACDPSLGREGGIHDDTAIVTLLKHRPTGVLYVVDADIRKLKPRETISTIIEFHRIRKYSRFAIETNQFQDFLATELKREVANQNAGLRIHPLKHTTDKKGRIESLEPLISSGRMQFSRKHRTLIEQLRQFPKAAHDDGPDALEMAVAATRVGTPGVMFIDLFPPKW
ncbi:MAG: phage terminase large subunit [Planctomycetes bacterium]|nr:phage terminase large subunit [Planctomycetota bacterium]